MIRFFKRATLYPLAVLFIIFDDLIYRKIVTGIFSVIKSLGIVQWIDGIIAKQNRYVTLMAFLLCFIMGEGLSMVSIAAAVSGHVIEAVLIYLIKIMLALYAFVILNQQKDKLFSFGWFRYAYDKVVWLVYRIKSSVIYSEVNDALHQVKRYLYVRSRKGALLRKIKRIAVNFKSR